MRPMINAELAPPTVANILYGLVVNNEAREFMGRTLRGARDESFSLIDERGKANSRSLFLVTLLQAGVRSEKKRSSIVQRKGFMDDYTDDDLRNWDGLILAILFASKELLDVMLSEIPPDTKGLLIAQMPPEQQPLARAHYQI